MRELVHLHWWKKITTQFCILLQVSSCPSCQHYEEHLSSVWVKEAPFLCLNAPPLNWGMTEGFSSCACAWRKCLTMCASHSLYRKDHSIPLLHPETVTVTSTSNTEHFWVAISFLLSPGTLKIIFLQIHSLNTSSSEEIKHLGKVVDHWNYNRAHTR